MASKPPEETRFTVLSHESVNLFAETIGITGLSTALSKSLAEDTTYRIRHIIQVKKDNKNEDHNPFGT